MQYRVQLLSAALAALVALPLASVHATAQRAPAAPPVAPNSLARSVPPVVLNPLSAGTPAPRFPQPRTARGDAAIQHGYGQLPLSFEQNRGQAPSSARFIAHGAGYGLALSPTEAIFTLLPSGTRSPRGANGGRSTKLATLHMRLAGALAHPKIEGREKLPGIVSYFIGKDPAKWHTSIPTFGKVRCSNVYRGIDLVYYGNRQQLEYDFIVAPKADPSKIAFRFDGAQRLTVDKTGTLNVAAGGKTLRWLKPSVYQNVGGKRRSVQGRFVLRGKTDAGFRVARYDRNLPLVIDPVLLGYSTYLRDSTPSGIAVDHDGDAYVTGTISNAGFEGAETGYTGAADAFIVKLDPSGSRLLYATYFGGTTGATAATAIAIDAAGNAFIAGHTAASDLAIRNGFQTTSGGGSDAFVAKISTTGAGLLYSTYLGGAGSDSATGIAVTAAGNAYVCGGTGSAAFPPKSPYQSVMSGSGGGFITVISTAGIGGGSLLYSTFLNDSSPGAIAVDHMGNFYVLGVGYSGFPAVNAFQDTVHQNQGSALCIAEFTPDGSRIAYSSFLNPDYFGLRQGGDGGGLVSSPSGIVVNDQQQAYLVGTIMEFVGPTGIVNTYLVDARFNCAASGQASFGFGSISGGIADYTAGGIGVDVWGNILIGGTLDSKFSPGASVYVTRLSASGEQQEVAGSAGTAFGSDSEIASRIHLTGFTTDAAGNMYGTGYTNKFDFPVTSGAYQQGPSPPTSVENTGFVFKMPSYTPLDFGDLGMTDLLFQNRGNGDLVYWLMNGATATSEDYLFPASPGVDWRIVATADLNGDNSTDLVFQNQKNGDLAYWLMQMPDSDVIPRVLGSVATNIGFLTPKNPGANWNVVGMADFNRDGFPDILFQNSVTGQLYVWYMKGTTLIAGAFISPSDPGAGWSVAAVGDMNNDGQADILFQNAANGDLYVWYLHDNALVSSEYLNPANPGPGWQAVGLAHITTTGNSLPTDARPDIIFQNVDTGLLAYWTMDGPNLVNYALPQPYDPGPDWKLVGPK
jgi:hypothetical protein